MGSGRKKVKNKLKTGKKGSFRKENFFPGIKGLLRRKSFRETKIFSRKEDFFESYGSFGDLCSFKRSIISGNKEYYFRK